MQTVCIQTTVQAGGTVILQHLPFQVGEPIEIIVLARKQVQDGATRYPLRGTPTTYLEPTEPVATSDWGALP